MKASQIRKAFLEYFRSKAHRVVPSSPLVPQDDPTLLFTNAGMVQFKKVFLGEEKRDYTRAVSCQKCMRVGGKHNDLENVGYTARHHTFFEMLGNFSFGDYFKEEAIHYAWEFLTRVMGLPRDRLWVTVFEEDEDAERIWTEKIGLPGERVVRMGEADNFWSMADTGPCGPCSEVLIDQGPQTGCRRPTCNPACECDRYLELWNLVFMEYNRHPDGTLEPLPDPSIDTGMGLERITAVLQGKTSNYDTDLFIPVIKEIEKLASCTYHDDAEKDVSIRAIADHARATAFLIAEGIFPSNEGRGYVLRRIIRRAVRHGNFLGLREPFLHRVVPAVVELMGDVYPELKGAESVIEQITRTEEERFLETLERGLAILTEETQRLRKEGSRVLSGPVAFKLYDTYGFPLDLTEDILKKEGMRVDTEGFNREMALQRERSATASSVASLRFSSSTTDTKTYRELADGGVKTTFVGYHEDVTSSKVLAILKDGMAVESADAGETVEVITEETPFYGESGGQVGDTGVIVGKELSMVVVDTRRPLPELITHICTIKEGTLRKGMWVELAPNIERRASIARNHTATHILHSVLRRLLGEHVKQAGSLVAPDRLRFDFTHFTALNPEEIARIEEEVNRIIRENLEVTVEMMPLDEALKKGALALFGEKYESMVRVVSVGDVSVELCGGTHVKRSSDVGLFKITRESSVASGIRRIEALTGEMAFRELNNAYRTLSQTALLLNVKPEEVAERVKKLVEEKKALETALKRAEHEEKKDLAGTLLKNVKTVDDVKVVSGVVEDVDADELRRISDVIRQRLKSCVVVLGTRKNGKATLIASVTKDLAERIPATSLIKELAPLIDGRGGGKPTMAQAGGKGADKVLSAVEKTTEFVKQLLG